MTQNEFLSQLREALENELSEQAVQGNVQYYRSYIEEEIRKGRSEEEVLSELGDPWVIAKTIISSPNSEQQYQKSERDYAREGRREQNQDAHDNILGKWWQKLLLLLVIVAIVAAVISIVTGVISFVMPILAPVLLIIILVKIINRNK